jgi:Right handed beta helix region
VRGGMTSFVGFQLFGQPPGAPSALRGFKVVAPAPVNGSAIEVVGVSELTVEDVTIDGPGLLIAEGVASATVDRLDVDCGGTGIGFHMELGTNGAVSDSRFVACDRGVRNGTGTLSIVDSIAERCEVGIETFSDFASLEVTGCELTDNRTGIQAIGGLVDITDTSIRDSEATPEPSLRGISLRRAGVTVTGCEIVGQDQVGVTGFSSVEDPGFALRLTDVLIDGGPVGVAVDGRDNPNSLVMRDSIVRNQTAAAVRISIDEFNLVTVDLGNGGGPGGNQLSVLSGVALHDLRQEPDEFSPIDATGILLNGRSYAGQRIQGPASQLPDYQIVADGAIQF